MGSIILSCRRASLAGVVITLAACASATHPPALPVQPVAAGNEARTLARADSAWNAGSYVLARQLYESLITANPAQPRAVFRAATLMSWDNRLDDAIAVFRRFIALAPSDPVGRPALARVLAWKGQYDAAIAIYDSVIAADGGNRDAVLGRAQTLAWAGRLDESVASYKAWQIKHPADNEAAIGYARSLAWNGQLADAEDSYLRLAKMGDANAQKGLARVIAWRGNLEGSERAWREVLDERPNDVEALTGLAEVLRGQGRETDAEHALQQALTTDPANGDARALLQWVRADIRPRITVTGTGENDSDKNRSAVARIDYVARAWAKGTVGARYIDRTSNFAAIDSRAENADLFARWRPASWDLRIDGGMTHHSSSFTPATSRDANIWTGAFNVAGIPSKSVSIAAGVTREAFDETALLIASGVRSTEVAGEVGFALPARLRLSGAASHSSLTGGVRDNARNAYSGSLRWLYNRRWSVAIGGRQYGYDTTSADGYFSPRRYILAEGSARAAFGGQLGWNMDADVGLGRQQIDFFGSSASPRLAERAALSAGYRLDPSRELSLLGSYANVAGPGQTGGNDYRSWSFSLRARLGL